LAVNAIHLASSFIGHLQAAQQRLISEGAQDTDYAIPYSTLHVGKIEGGKALNIVPNLCTLDFEFRSLPDDSAESLLEHLRDSCEAIVREARRVSAVAAIDIAVLNEYPGLQQHPTVDAVRLLKQFAPADTSMVKVSFGTEGGLFASRLNVPVVVCGPGSIEQAHKPDEFVTISQMEAGELFLGKLCESLFQ